MLKIHSSITNVKNGDRIMLEALQEIAFKHITYELRKLIAYLSRGSKLSNHKRV